MFGKQSPEDKKKNDLKKLEAARAFKSEGNECFKLKNLKGAIRKYHQSILYLKAIGIATTSHTDLTGLVEQAPPEASLSQESKQEATQLGIDCFNNLAACMLGQESPNYEKIVQHCNDSLKLGETTKALYRKGIALYHLNDVDRAMEALKKASNRADGQKDPNIRKYMGLCSVEISKQDNKLKETYKGMF
ncbi:tetratricopeptide repeat protein 9C-like [Tubulanus polymorphus]|uniref:tetratricopeptide repeat protein 9C-like n=1 Tax=Tubulanus polymorphus TaxID=672921 RepID=UPI003DA6C959